MMAAWQDKTEAHLRDNEKVMGSDYAYTLGLEMEFDHALEPMARLKETARRLAAGMGFGSLNERNADVPPNTVILTRSNAWPNLNKDGGTRVTSCKYKQLLA